MSIVSFKHCTAALALLLTSFFFTSESRAGHALLIAYPDSKISVNFLSLSKMELGHAGILLISDSGVTKYYEFGRYDRAGNGLVRNVSLPNVSFDSSGSVNKRALKNVLESLSRSSGQRGRILSAYVPKVNYSAMNKFVQDSMRDWPKYHWYSNNCATYAAAVLRSGSPANSPLFNNLITTPENIVKDFLLFGAGEVKYDPKLKTFCFQEPGPWFLKMFEQSCQSLSSL